MHPTRLEPDLHLAFGKVEFADLFDCHQSIGLTPANRFVGQLLGLR